MMRPVQAVAALLVFVCVWHGSAVARAQPYYSGYYGWWGPPPPPPPRLVAVGGQYYDFTPTGLIGLCEAEPALCASPVQQSMVRSIKLEQTLGWTFLFTGIGTGVAGAVVLVTAPCTATGDCVSNARGITGASLLFSSLAFELTAAFLWPSTSELVRLVNDINRGHVEDPPVKLQATWLAPDAPGAMLSLRF